MRKPIVYGLILFALHGLLVVALYRDWLPLDGPFSDIGAIMAGYAFVFQVPAWLLGLLGWTSLLTSRGPWTLTPSGWWLCSVFWLFGWPMLVAAVIDILQRIKAP